MCSLEVAIIRVPNGSRTNGHGEYSREMDPTPTEIVEAAIDALLSVIANSVEDLTRFRDTVAKARVGAPFPPFPRTAVATTERIVRHLQLVELDLHDVLIALGLTPER
jgi:hypothetical protein